MTTEGWKHLGSCAGSSGELFFPTDDDRKGWVECKKICAGCPVRVQCLDYAMETKTWGRDTGCWGGTSPKERRRLNRQRKKAA